MAALKHETNRSTAISTSYFEPSQLLTDTQSLAEEYYSPKAAIAAVQMKFPSYDFLQRFLNSPKRRGALLMVRYTRCVSEIGGLPERTGLSASEAEDVSTPEASSPCMSESAASGMSDKPSNPDISVAHSPDAGTYASTSIGRTSAAAEGSSPRMDDPAVGSAAMDTDDEALTVCDYFPMGWGMGEARPILGPLKDHPGDGSDAFHPEAWSSTRDGADVKPIDKSSILPMGWGEYSSRPTELLSDMAFDGCPSYEIDDHMMDTSTLG